MAGRRAGELVSLEVEILRVMRDVLGDGERVHGFRLAEHLRGAGGRALTAHGTLYKALARMQASAMLDAVWEDADTAQAAGRPRRKLYAATAAGLTALAVVERPSAARPGLRAVGNAS